MTQTYFLFLLCLLASAPVESWQVSVAEGRSQLVRRVLTRRTDSCVISGAYGRTLSYNQKAHKSHTSCCQELCRVFLSQSCAGLEVLLIPLGSLELVELSFQPSLFQRDPFCQEKRIEKRCKCDDGVLFHFFQCLPTLRSPIEGFQKI